MERVGANEPAGGKRPRRRQDPENYRGPVDNQETELFTSAIRQSGFRSRGATRGPPRGAPRGITRGLAHLPPRPSVEAPGGRRTRVRDREDDSSPYRRTKLTTPRQSTPMSRSTGTVIVFVTDQGQGQDLLNDNGLFDFITRKVSREVEVNISSKRSNPTTNTVSFLVDNISQAKAIAALSGIRYNGQKLTITTSEDARIQRDRPSEPSSRSSVGQKTLNAIQVFVRSRYNGGFLNLEKIGDDDILRAANVAPPGASSRSESGTTIIRTAAELFPDASTISFASNELKSLRPIASLAQYFPKLMNLSLKGNRLRDFKDLDALSGPKALPHLRELILLDNPVRDVDIALNKDDISYRSEITKRFPSIQMLDQTPVSGKIQFNVGDIVESPKLPMPIRGNFFDSQSTQETVNEFLLNYFTLFDADRSMLEHVYDAGATFSYSIVTTAPPSKGPAKNTPGNWHQYISGSRNLHHTQELGARTSRLHVGNKAIVHQGLKPLPQTVHDLSDGAKYSIDAWQMTGLLPSICIYIMVHGEFEERLTDRRSRRSFERSFIVAPALQGSSAAANGWKCIIISDQLTMRSYSGAGAWTHATSPSNNTPAVNALSANAAPIPASIPSTGATMPLSAVIAANIKTSLPNAPALDSFPMPGMSQVQHQKALELQQLTRLKYAYAVECLTSTDWNVAAGAVLVEQRRASLPSDAWQ